MRARAQPSFTGAPSNPHAAASIPAVSLAATAATFGANVSLPLGYLTLLESFLAASKVGDVYPYFSPQNKTVPAGSTTTLVTLIPSGTTAVVPFLLKLRCDTYSPEFFVTLQSDNYPPVLLDAPMNEPIDLLGSFLPPAHTQGTYTLTNNDDVDIMFSAGVQLVIMSPQFTRSVYRPLVEGQLQVLADLATQLTSLTGGVAP